ncbi:MAG: N-6 DNA methylase [Rhodobacteraceae bacterium]|nr:N-6 DNA methylase [Paracoccaceae bacterium]
MMNHDYTDYIGAEHRKSFGQYFTHPSIANFMIEWVIESGLKSIFDPAFGLGEFFTQSPDACKNSYSAMEIDFKILDFWKKRTGCKSDFVTCGNYLHSWGMKHDNIVCNPPYMRFQKFVGRQKVFSNFKKYLDIELSGYTNVASAFLVKSLSELNKGGRLAYIMPLEFLNSGYGIYVKKLLLETGHLVGIIQFNCEKEIFPDATTSVGIILVDKSKSSSSVKFFSFSRIRDIEDFQHTFPISEISIRNINERDKWQPYFNKNKVEINKCVMTNLLYYGRFTRGIATGANNFFSLNRSKISEIGINESLDCKACISKSFQIRKPFFEMDDLLTLMNDDKPVFLFSAHSTASPEVRSYIKTGESKGLHKRYVTKNRKPWYKSENREPAPLLFGVFTRGKYKVIRNTSKALNLTCFHGFYPNLFGLNYVDHLFLFLSSDIGRKIVAQVSRYYGDDLGKFEPNDINNALVPKVDFFDTISHNEILEAVAEYKKTDLIPSWLEAKFENILIPSTLSSTKEN